MRRATKFCRRRCKTSRASDGPRCSTDQRGQCTAPRFTGVLLADSARI